MSQIGTTICKPGTAPSWARAVAAITGVVGFALLTAGAAQVRVYLPTTPVPMTLQTAAVLSAGVVLGPRLGLASMALYLLLGMVGVPVYADGGSGLSVAFGATGGYLLGFVLAQPIVGALALGRCGRPRRFWRVVLAVLAGQGVMYLLGLVWLGVSLGLGPIKTIEEGLIPFLPGAVLKALLAAELGRSGARAAGRVLR